jgi:hypothetical protein
MPAHTPQQIFQHHAGASGAEDLEGVVADYSDLAVACLSKGRTVILTMPIHPDGSLSGKWSRRTDRGTQGTETWTRT